MTFFLKILSKNVILFIILFCMSNNDIVGMEPNESTNDQLCEKMKVSYYQERVRFFDTDYNKLLTGIYIHCIKGQSTDFHGKWPSESFNNPSNWINHLHISDIIGIVNEGKEECLNLFYSSMSNYSNSVPELIVSFLDQAFYLSYFNIIVNPIKCESNPQTDMPTQKGNLDNQRVEQSKSQEDQEAKEKEAYQKAKEKQEGEWKKLISFIASNGAMFNSPNGLCMAFELFQYFKNQKNALIGLGLPAIGKYEYNISLRCNKLNLNKTDKGKALLEKKDFITLIKIMELFFIESGDQVKAGRWMGVSENNYENMTFGHLCDIASALQECKYQIGGLNRESSNNKQNIIKELGKNKEFFALKIAPLLRDLFCTSEINWPKEWAIFECLVKGFPPQTLELRGQELVQKNEELEKSNAQLVKEKKENEFLLSEKKKQMNQDADTIWFWQKVAITSVSTSIMGILFMVSYYLMYIKPMH